MNGGFALSLHPLLLETAVSVQRLLRRGFCKRKSLNISNLETFGPLRSHVKLTLDVSLDDFIDH